jgi:hypothetical protein
METQRSMDMERVEDDCSTTTFVCLPVACLISAKPVGVAEEKSKEFRSL